MKHAHPHNTTQHTQKNNARYNKTLFYEFVTCETIVEWILATLWDIQSLLDMHRMYMYVCISALFTLIINNMSSQKVLQILESIRVLRKKGI